MASLEFDAVLGIPRSGMLPAAMIALLRNKPLSDIDGFIEGRILKHGATRAVPFSMEYDDIRRVLVVDDSVASGASIRRAQNLIRRLPVDATYLAVFKSPDFYGDLDLFLEEVPVPRIFEWNMWHSWFTSAAAFDLDGIFCRDPSSTENDDGPEYKKFIRSASPVVQPTVKVGHIVSARLERYRSYTEAWLRSSAIEFGALHLLDASAEERREGRLHAKFKADFYTKHDVPLFVESELWQAREIAKVSCKPVLYYPGMQLILPEQQDLMSLSTSFGRRVVRRLRGLVSSSTTLGLLRR